MGQPGQPVQHPTVQPQGAPAPGRPGAAPPSSPNAPAGAPGRECLTEGQVELGTIRAHFLGPLCDLADSVLTVLSQILIFRAVI